MTEQTRDWVIQWRWRSGDRGWSAGRRPTGRNEATSPREAAYQWGRRNEFTCDLCVVRILMPEGGYAYYEFVRGQPQRVGEPS